MAIKFPPHDTQGSALQTQITSLTAVAAAASSATQLAQQQQLDALQRSAVRHAMATGFRTAASILTGYTVPAGDAIGQQLQTAVTTLGSQITTATTQNPGLLSTLQQQLNAAQTALIEHLMDGGRAASAGATAASILANA